MYETLEWTLYFYCNKTVIFDVALNRICKIIVIHFFAMHEIYTHTVF
jgi:mRNA-degrading endonuclease HigB of HigAB toxin-antitoxin module